MPLRSMEALQRKAAPQKVCFTRVAKCSHTLDIRNEYVQLLPTVRQSRKAYRKQGKYASADRHELDLSPIISIGQHKKRLHGNVFAGIAPTQFPFEMSIALIIRPDAFLAELSVVAKLPEKAILAALLRDVCILHAMPFRRQKRWITSRSANTAIGRATGPSCSC